MKRTLGPSWTAEQIAAGERFGRAWLDFFGRPGAAAPVLPHDLDAAAGSRAAIRIKHEARLLAYPNVVGVTEGTRTRRGKPTNEPVIVVLVSRKVPRDSLTQASRLPSRIDGVAIDGRRRKNSEIIGLTALSGLLTRSGGADVRLPGNGAARPSAGPQPCGGEAVGLSQGASGGSRDPLSSE